MSLSGKPSIRTYGSKPRKVSTTALWDGSRDVPRPRALAETTNHINHRRKNSSGLTGLVKGVVEWLSPKKARSEEYRNILDKENNPSKLRKRVPIEDEEEVSDVESIKSVSTLVASTPKKESAGSETKQGVELLLQFCSKEEVVAFSEYMSTLLENAKVEKLGEASYSEVYTLTTTDGNTTVLKVVPFSDTLQEKDTGMSNLDDILQEIRISRAMTKLEGFADFRGAMVVKGLYPEQLLSAWDSYASNKKSENDRPSKFSDGQTYCIIQLAHHGQDLESYPISTWSEAAHIFWSVVRALAKGEEEGEFEHRDLHWGNILIDKSEEDEILERLLDNLNLEDGAAEFDGGWGGVKVTLIDYTLSRARVDDAMGSIAHYRFEDEEIFEGKRDYQFDVYRQMRSIVCEDGNSSWEEYNPATNVLWLHYLASKLLYGKQLPTPVTRLSARNQSKRRGHERSFSVILEGEDKGAYDGLLNIYNSINPKSSNSVNSAAKVLEIGKDNGWIV